MHATETHALTSCVDCGAEISVERDRGYAVDPDTALCFGCATVRRGVWDEAEDRWVEAPNLDGIAAEAALGQEA